MSESSSWSIPWHSSILTIHCQVNLGNPAASWRAPSTPIQGKSQGPLGNSQHTQPEVISGDLDQHRPRVKGTRSVAILAQVSLPSEQPHVLASGPWTDRRARPERCLPEKAQKHTHVLDVWAIAPFPEWQNPQEPYQTRHAGDDAPGTGSRDRLVQRDSSGRRSGTLEDFGPKASFREGTCSGRTQGCSQHWRGRRICRDWRVSRICRDWRRSRICSGGPGECPQRVCFRFREAQGEDIVHSLEDLANVLVLLD